MIHGHQVCAGRVGARPVGAHPAATRLREAFLAMAAHLPKRPHWSFHEVASRTDRSPVYHGTLRAIDSCIDAGAPIEDALAFTQELEVYIRSRYQAPDARPMSCLLLEEARADAAADVAQAEAMVAISPSSLQGVIETGERHMRRLREMIHAARMLMLGPGASKKPRLALARAGRGEVRHPETTARTGG